MMLDDQARQMVEEQARKMGAFGQQDVFQIQIIPTAFTVPTTPWIFGTLWIPMTPWIHLIPMIR